MTTPGTGFCPQCGGATGTGDAFCRECGVSMTTAADESMSSAQDEPSLVTMVPQRQHWLTKRRALWGGIAAFILVAGVGTAVALLSGGDGEKSTPKLSLSAVARKQYGTALAARMADRDRFFTLERNVLSPISQADAKMLQYDTATKDYQAESQRITDSNASAYANCSQFYVPCPSPSYPDSPVGPNLASETLLLRKAAADLRELSAKLGARTVPRALAVFDDQLRSATDLLAAQAEFDADVLTKTSYTYEGGVSVDTQEFATMKRDAALAAIQQMNRAVLAILKRLALEPQDFDVPGGRDIDPSDHSTALAASGAQPGA